MGSAPPCQHPRRAQPTSALPWGWCLHREQGREELSQTKISSLSHGKGLCCRVWFGLPSMALPGHEPPSALPAAAGAAFSSSKILKTFLNQWRRFWVAALDLIAGELFLHQPHGCDLPLGNPHLVWVWFLACCFCTSRTRKKNPWFLWKPLSLVFKQDLGVTKPFLFFILDVSKPLFPPSCFYSKHQELKGAGNSSFYFISCSSNITKSPSLVQIWSGLPLYSHHHSCSAVTFGDGVSSAGGSGPKELGTREEGSWLFPFLLILCL